MVQGLEITA